MAKNRTQLIGDENLTKLIKQLPKFSAQRRVWRGIARSGSKPIIDSARSKVPVRLGNLKKSIKYKNYSTRFFNGLGGYVYVKATGKMPSGAKFNNPAKASVLIHGRNSSKGDIKNRSRDFIREAGEDSKIEVLADMERNAKKFLEREIKKLI